MGLRGGDAYDAAYWRAPMGFGMAEYGTRLLSWGLHHFWGFPHACEFVTTPNLAAQRVSSPPPAAEPRPHPDASAGRGGDAAVDAALPRWSDDGWGFVRSLLARQLDVRALDAHKERVDLAERLPRRGADARYDPAEHASMDALVGAYVNFHNGAARAHGAQIRYLVLRLPGAERTAEWVERAAAHLMLALIWGIATQSVVLVESAALHAMFDSAPVSWIAASLDETLSRLSRVRAPRGRPSPQRRSARYRAAHDDDAAPTLRRCGSYAAPFRACVALHRSLVSIGACAGARVEAGAQHAAAIRAARARADRRSGP